MLVLENVAKRFGHVEAVAGVSLRIERGEVFGLLGPNGAGKTTTLAMAVGLIEPDSGFVEIQGVGPPASPAARRSLGFCPQSIALYDRLTARENLRFFGGLAGLGRGERRDRAEELLELVGLRDRAGERIAGYSGGMKRRLNLAAALLHEPELVLLDEPTVGVDPHSRSAIFDLVRRFRDEGRAVVYTTHYMEEAHRLCDRVGIIDNGRLRAIGTIRELVDRYGGCTTVSVERDGGVERFETERPIETIAAIDLGARGPAAVRGLRIDSPDLERVFMSLTGRSLRDG